MTPTSPFAYLLELAERGRALQRELTTQLDTKEETWTGVGFQVCRQKCVAPSGDVVEVITSPLVTRLPGVKSWVSGIANVRGRLLPIMDFGLFLTGTPVKRGISQRILVIEQGDIYLGLIVEDI